jgi:hypothetical protein
VRLCAARPGRRQRTWKKAEGASERMRSRASTYIGSQLRPKSTPPTEATGGGGAGGRGGARGGGPLVDLRAAEEVARGGERGERRVLRERLHGRLRDKNVHPLLQRVSSLPPYLVDASHPPPRTKWTRLVPLPKARGVGGGCCSRRA